MGPRTLWWRSIFEEEEEEEGRYRIRLG